MNSMSQAISSAEPQVGSRRRAGEFSSYLLTSFHGVRTLFSILVVVLGSVTFSYYIIALNTFLDQGKAFLRLVPEGSTISVVATPIKASGLTTAFICLILVVLTSVVMLWSIFDVFYIPGRGLAGASLVFQIFLLATLIVYTVYFATGSGTVTITGVPENISGFVDMSIERVYRNSYYLRVLLALAWTTWGLNLVFIVTCWMEEGAVNRKARRIGYEAEPMSALHRSGVTQNVGSQTEGIVSTPPTIVSGPVSGL